MKLNNIIELLTIIFVYILINTAFGPTSELSIIYFLSLIIIIKLLFKKYSIKINFNTIEVIKTIGIPLVIISMYILTDISIYKFSKLIYIENIIKECFTYILIKNLLIAIIEETIFREIIPNILKQKIKDNKVMIISSLLFSIGHIFSFNLELLAATFIGGILLYKLKSIYSLVCSIFFHWIYNVSITLFLFENIIVIIITITIITIIILKNKYYYSKVLSK